MKAKTFAVALLAQKGGVGKTTLCVNLAATAERAGLRAGIIDADPQATASGWARTREERGTSSPVVAAAPDPAKLRKALQDARDDGFDVVFIDTPAGVSELPVAAAGAAQLVLVPALPSVFNLDALAPTVRLVRRAGVPAFFVVNRGRSPGINAECALALSSAYGLPAVSVAIANRLPIADGERTATALVEVKGGPSSVTSGQKEFSALWAWIDKQRKGSDGESENQGRKVRRS